MIARRDVLAGLAAAVGTSTQAAETLKGQPPLPGPLDRYREVGVRRLDGSPSTLGRLLGPPRPSVVSFWATWCAPCVLEGRRLAQLRGAYPEEQLAILGVNINDEPDPATLAAFRQKARMNYAQALDGRGAYLALTGQAKLALPRVFVFDAAGRPVAAFGRFFGARTLDALEAAVRQAAG